MRITIVGAGAIGGLLGTRLAAAGHDVSALARGKTLAALRSQGWRLRSAGALQTARAAAVSDEARDLGTADLVVVAVKAHALPGLAPALAPLLGPHTRVLSAMNGVPWWFTPGLPGALAAPLDAVDPGAVIARVLTPERTVGGVIHMAASCPEPGLSDHRMGLGIILGDVVPDATQQLSMDSIAAGLETAGFEVTRSAAIRQDTWYKLWGNLTINPISALTGAMTDALLGDPLVRDYSAACMLETQAVGARLGCTIDQTPDDRHAVTLRLGGFKSSMLQDAEAGRALELDAIVGAVRELGARTGVPTPCIDTLYGLTRLFARTHGLLARA
jgi:2-dehydropantoate 2-reductase